MARLSEFQALVTGAVNGALMRASEHGLSIDSEVVVDENGYTNEILVTGWSSGEKLLVKVERVEP